MVAFPEADVIVLLSHPHSLNKYLSACYVSGIVPIGDLAVNKTDRISVHGAYLLVGRDSKLKNK